MVPRDLGVRQEKKPSNRGKSRLLDTLQLFTALLNDYCLWPPRPPAAQPRQMPKPLPLPMMLVQRLLMLASSPALRVAGVNAVSVTENGAGEAGTAPAPGM